MNDDVRERARGVIARTLADMYPMGEDHPPSAQDNLEADTTLAALDAAGIALVDATELERLREELDQVLVMLKPIIDKSNARAAVADSEPETAG